MVRVEDFCDILGTDFYAGVPDSLLKPFCNYIMYRYGVNAEHHIIGANEGNCVAIAAGYHLATGKVPVVYLQNSGEGNILNPVASLIDKAIYSIPIIFVIGWRGAPGVHDEPQHLRQGIITLQLLELLNISYFVVSEESTLTDISSAMEFFRRLVAQGKSSAFVIHKGALTFENEIIYKNNFLLRREEAIKKIIQVARGDFILSTTGKISRELFELRKECGETHDKDFLTVGSMGHCSSIALGAALQQAGKKFWCLDGDGAVLMHMGAMATIGAAKPKNLIHVVFNNAAHESVGGLPTVADKIDLPAIARACGYDFAAEVKYPQELEEKLSLIKENNCLSFLEIKCALGSRKDLGRPNASPIENKLHFMQSLQTED